MRLVIDTNIFVAAISSKSKYHWILQSFLNGDFELCVSNDIINENNEIIQIKYGLDIAYSFVQTLINSSNLSLNNVYFFWNLIDIDESDNKFVDCYLSCNADYLLTEDRHFDILKKLKFPLITIIRITDFKDIVSGKMNK